jgi:predicted nucleic acid-binding protein
MHNPIISDTSCFIVLSNIGELHLLQRLYGEVITTPEIAKEYGEELPEWVNIQEVTDKSRQEILESQIDIGESSAMALAMEIPDSTLILDDYKARKIASRLRLKFTGTVGVIIKAKKRGFIPLIKPLLERIKQTDFRMSEELETLALTEAGE